MQRKITGYHQDELGDWVAELDCLHGQHQRHKPPFFNRPWVETEAGRQGRLGTELNCLRCDRLEFPEGLAEYERTPVFTEETVPPALLEDHGTKAGAWGRIHVLEGVLRYTVFSARETSLELRAGDVGTVPPRMKYHVAPQRGTRFYVAFFRKA